MHIYNILESDYIKTEVLPMVLRRDVDVDRLLLKHGADASIKDKDGFFPTKYAVNVGFGHIAELMDNALVSAVENNNKDDESEEDEDEHKDEKYTATSTFEKENSTIVELEAEATQDQNVSRLVDAIPAMRDSELDNDYHYA